MEPTTDDTAVYDALLRDPEIFVVGTFVLLYVGVVGKVAFIVDTNGVTGIVTGCGE
jgi:hypothetical protein